ncbi:MAG: hypothetical protein EPN25_10840 [Nitrospirae bacterium]|nr:MAG: hypothetical protein EPN25_10840 [Nitrospirota bacterium]
MRRPAAFFLAVALIITLPGALVSSGTTSAYAAASFDIRSISLYFENRRPEITIEQGDTNLLAFADMTITGSGLLQGYWEVDGRSLGRVNLPVTSGTVVRLTTPKVPALPTADAGSHILRFVVTNPQTRLQGPSALYFVVPKEVSCSIKTIILTGPADGADLAYAPATFQWEKNSDTTTYLVAFYEKPDSKPLFSAYTKSDSYTLPEQVIKTTFSAGKKYFWKVTGFDKNNHTICENRRQSFTFK